MGPFERPEQTEAAGRALEMLHLCQGHALLWDYYDRPLMLHVVGREFAFAMSAAVEALGW